MLRIPLLTLVVVLAAGSTSSADLAPGLGDAGSLTSVLFDETDVATISGREYRLQLVVTGKYSSGQVRDLTRDAVYTSDPQGTVEIDGTGLVTPLADGTVTVTAKTADGKTATRQLTVSAFADGIPVSFANEVVPVFTKSGCNAGNCHGKSGGQNGFSLSLLGFYPRDDHRWLTQQTLGRRISIAQPDRSLLLLKSAAELPHGGGHKFDKDSPEYRVIRHWIAQGAAYGDESVRKVARIEAIPRPRQLPRGRSQQVAVIATYVDGSREDVTRLARYESNNADICEASDTGLVTIGQSTGNLAVMIRYQGQATVFSSTVPLGLPVDNLPAENNLVDRLANRKFRELGLPPSGLCDDSTFIRRVTVDIAGRLPTPDEAWQFLADKDPAKRDHLVDQLLTSTDYADNFAKKWSDLLRNRPAPGEKTATPYFMFHAWIRDSLQRNRPYDQFVRDIVAAAGSEDEHPPVVWYRKLNLAQLRSGNPDGLATWMEDTAQMFLGTRLQCAKCHHHPFEKWSQNDYYSFLAFFSRLQKKKVLGDLRPNDDNVNVSRVHHSRGIASARNPRNNQTVKPAGLGQTPVDISPDVDPRHVLVDWLASPDNPFFERALVNRYWKHFHGRGLVEAEDDMRATNPPSNPELLDEVARHFIDSGFDLKNLVRTIATSNLYQLSSTPSDHNRDDRQNFSHFYARRLNAEVLLDASDSVAGTKTSFNGLGGVPPQTRAVELPHGGFGNGFLSTFGMPSGNSACECERSTEVTLAQSLKLINSSFIQDKVYAQDGRAARLATEQERTLEDKTDEMFLAAWSRLPDSTERDVVRAHVESKEEKVDAYRDIIWALINSKEFVFQH